MLYKNFFDRDTCQVAQALLGKVIQAKREDVWLRAQIVETEAYYLTDKASHASLGYTKKRAALFMPAGTIYMYYARGKDSLNVSCQGDGNAVLIKAAIPYEHADDYSEMLKHMQHLNPLPSGVLRQPHRLCAGQTLLCKSLGIKLTDWDQQQFCPERFHIADVGYQPKQIIQTTRLGIPSGRDELLPYRFIDHDYIHAATSKPKVS